MKRDANKLSLIVLLFLIALVLPTDIGVMVAGLRINPYRFILLLTIIPILYYLLAGKESKINKTDLFITLHCLWVFISFSVNHGFAFSLETGGIYVVECLGSYLIGRCLVPSLLAYKKVMLIFFIILIFLMIFTIPEALFGKHTLRELSASTLGSGSFKSTINERMGLTRAFGTFDHPITLGVFSAGLFSMLYFYGKTKHAQQTKIRYAGTIASLVALTSVSAGAMATLVIQYIILIWLWFCKLFSFKNPWKRFWMCAFILYITIDIFSNRTPLKVFLTYMTFSAHTAYNRYNIWIFGRENVIENPWLGLGFHDWSRPAWMHSDSMDNFWLVNAVRYGIPGFLFLALAVFCRLNDIRKIKTSNIEFEYLAKGYIYSMIGISIAATTVHLWNASLIYFIFLLGIGNVFLIKTETVNNTVDTDDYSSKSSSSNQTKATTQATSSENKNNFLKF